MQCVTAVPRAKGVVKREVPGKGWKAERYMITFGCKDAGAMDECWAQCTQDVSCGRREFAGAAITPRKRSVRLAGMGWCVAMRQVSTVRERDTVRISGQRRQLPCVVVGRMDDRDTSLSRRGTAGSSYTTNQVKCSNTDAVRGVACCTPMWGRRPLRETMRFRLNPPSIKPDPLPEFLIQRRTANTVIGQCCRNRMASGRFW